MTKQKIILSILIIIISINLTKAQSNYSGQVFSNTQGIKQEETTFYEAEGYSIFIHIHKVSFDDKGFNKIKKKYSINKDILPISDTVFQNSKILLTTKNITKKVKESGVYYLIPHGQKVVKVIGLITLNKRDEQLEKFFIKSIIENSIPDNVYTPMVVDSIKFAGRYIVLGPACNWKGTHNLQCPNLGQMNWSEFRNLDKAKEMVISQFDIAMNKSISEVIQKDTIDILFEGKETKALKVKFKIKVPQLIMGGSNILVVYYVATEVREKYVACVLSHYTDDVNAKNLPPLLSEVMKLK